METVQLDSKNMILATFTNSIGQQTSDNSGKSEIQILQSNCIPQGLEGVYCPGALDQVTFYQRYECQKFNFTLWKRMLLQEPFGNQ